MDPKFRLFALPNQRPNICGSESENNRKSVIRTPIIRRSKPSTIKWSPWQTQTKIEVLNKYQVLNADLFNMAKQNNLLLREIWKMVVRSPPPAFGEYCGHIQYHISISCFLDKCRSHITKIPISCFSIDIDPIFKMFKNKPLHLFWKILISYSRVSRIY